MNILVTGGAGFIGSHLAETLLRLGHQVTVQDNLSTGKASNLAGRCSLIRGDIRDRDCVDRCVKGQNVVFHLAAYTSVPGSLVESPLCFETNVQGTLNLLESAARWGVGRIVFASTSALYPDLPDGPMGEHIPPDPQTPYAQSKLSGETLLQRFHRDRGLSYAALRFFNVYGPRQDAQSDYAAVIPIFFCRSLRGEPLIIYGDGSQTRDFVYVEDVVSALMRAMGSEVCGVFNVGTGYPVSVLTLAKMIISAVGSHSDYVFADPRPGDVASSTADISLISSQLGWTPQWSVRAGLERTAAWFGAHPSIDVR
jgi:UDP-glucose 4-epimerase